MTMRYRFDQFELDTEAYELRGPAGSIHIEPLVFDLLRFLLEHAGQVVTRDAIIENVWKGRVVSDATVSSCVKSARKALGDNGKQQIHIRTIRGRGFQFVAAADHATDRRQTAVQSGTRAPDSSADTPAAALQSPPKIAVLPFYALSHDPTLALHGDALAQEVILELSRLHWLFVIARGSSFQLRGQEGDLAKAAEVLGVSYFLTGTILQQERQSIISVELSHVADSRVVWAERFITPTDELMHMRSTIAGEIVSALEPRIQFSEALKSTNISTDHLDAWAAYHRGLRHMYRFNREDNDLAAHLFAHAAKLDPSFARAHAGLSFTHFQNAFLGFTSDQENNRREARLHADKALNCDALDPFVNLMMGRTEWLSGNLEAGLPWMERSMALSPNYAFAVYNSALVGTLLGEGDSNETRVAKAISLSPIDPLNYAMLATRALTHVVRGNFGVAAEWAERAVRSPNAHVHIYAIASFSNELIGNRPKAEAYIDHIRLQSPSYCKFDFLKAFPFRDTETFKKVEQSLKRLGL